MLPLAAEVFAEKSNPKLNANSKCVFSLIDLTLHAGGSNAIDKKPLH